MPKTIIKDVRDVIEMGGAKKAKPYEGKHLNNAEREELIKKITAEMKQAAKMLEFEYAAEIRDKIEELKRVK